MDEAGIKFKSKDKLNQFLDFMSVIKSVLSASCQPHNITSGYEEAGVLLLWSFCCCLVHACTLFRIRRSLSMEPIANDGKIVEVGDNEPVRAAANRGRD